MKTVSESDWIKVFRYRCRSKRGERLTDAEAALCSAAWKADKKRYSDMTTDVFNATRPWGEA